MLLDLYDSLCICKGSCIDISVFDVHAMIRYCLMKMNELVYSTVYINNNLHCTCLLLLPSVTQHDCQFQLPIGWGWEHITKLFSEPGVAYVSRCCRSSCCWAEGRNKPRLATSMVAVLNAGLVVRRFPGLTHIHLDKLGQPHCDITKNDGEEWESSPKDLIQVLKLLQFIQIHFCLDKP